MTVLELKKLMIDDFVYSKKYNQVVRIWAVGPMYVQYYANGTLCQSGEEDIEPVVLTEEILKKLGFTPRRVIGWEDRDLYFWEGDNAYVRLVPLSYKNSSWYDLKIESIDSDDLRRGDLRRTMVKYVHEMQQAFRLNGINKELNLMKED